MFYLGMLAGWTLMTSHVWLAAETKSPSAVTRLDQVDADFQVQGEYTGVATWQGCCQGLGLQIVAMGDGEFQGLLYPGGLPGNGYSGAAKVVLKGKREGETVALTDGQWTATWAPGRAIVLSSSSGHPLGYLQPLQRYSLRTGAQPPAGAKILFNGTDTGLLKDAKISEEGLLQIGAETRDPVQDFWMHVEFKTPYMPNARGQARGNSGVYIQRRYEVQILDSFGMEPAVNEVASLYKFKAPDLNMSFPPLSWQTYDIQFTAARFDGEGKKIGKAHITVWHNGVVVQNNVALENKTGGGRPESPEPLPILFQNHGNPVEFRNIWLVDLVTPTCVPVTTPMTTRCCCSKAGRRSRR